MEYVSALRLWVFALGGFCGTATGQPAPVQIQPIQEITVPSSNAPLAVELHGDWLFVGLPIGGFFENAGETHVFRRSDASCDGSPCWTWWTSLPYDRWPAVGDGFGTSLEFDGWTLFVGAPSDPRSNSGRVLVFGLVGDQFILQQVLTVPDAEPSFGYRLSLDRHRLAISAGNFDTEGAIYLFERRGNEWVYTDRVSTPNDSGQQFGYSVDLRGNQLIAGANEEDYAVIFRRRGGVWREQARITSPGASSFGIGAEVRGNEAFVSAHGDATISHFLRDRAGWSLIDAYPLPLEPDFFPPSAVGGPLQLQGNRLFAGGAGGIYLLKPRTHGGRPLAQFVTPGHIEFSDEGMDVSKRFLAGIAGRTIYVFDTSSVR